MWTQLLNVLSMTGLYAPASIVLNDSIDKGEVINAPPHVVAYASAQIMQWMIEDYTEDDGRLLDYEAFRQSLMYTRNIKGVFRNVLLNLDPSQMDEYSRKAFFTNMYNILTIDAILSMDELPEQTVGVPQFWRKYEYRIGQHTINLDEIEHGILRGNAPHPDGTVFFDNDDPRAPWTVPLDLRIHAALNCGAKSCPPLAAFFPDSTFEGSLDAATENFCTLGVTLENDGSLTINSIFEWYAIDFASTEEGVLRWISECNPNPKIKLALQEASNGTREYAFDYDWNLNNVVVPYQSSGPVNVHVYIESLCPDTKKFFLNQLHRNWPVLKKMVNLKIIPFGKASAIPREDNSIDFKCQHGPDECYGNIVQSCAVKMFDIDQQVEFIACMFRNNDEANPEQQCAERLNLPWRDINACVEGSEGPRLLYANGVTTSKLRPPLFFVPTVTFDEKYSRRSLSSTLGNFMKEVCSRYTGPKPWC